MDEDGVSARMNNPGELNAACCALGPFPAVAGVGVTSASSERSVGLDTENERVGFRGDTSFRRSCKDSFAVGSAERASSGKLISEGRGEGGMTPIVTLGLVLLLVCTEILS